MIVIFALIALSGCAMGTAGPNAPYQPFPGQGQYVRPAWLEPQPPARIPATDTCGARVYQRLVGVHEGSIYIPALPGSKRIIRPAVFEGPDNDFLNGEMMNEVYVQVQTYQAGQQLFAPSTAMITDRITVGPEIEDRLTIELDNEGYVHTIGCG